MQLSFRLKVLPENSSIIDLLSDGSNNAFITDTEHLTFLEKSLNGSKKFTKLREIFLSDYLGFQFLSSDFFLIKFDQIITQLLESGISEYLFRNEATVKHGQEVDEEAVVLESDQFTIWFYFIALLFTISIFIFLLEIVFHKFSFKFNESSEENITRETFESDVKIIGFCFDLQSCIKRQSFKKSLLE